jgi:uncharacterized protein
VIDRTRLDRAVVVRVAPFALLLAFGLARRFAPGGLLLGVDARWLEPLSVVLVGALVWHWRREYLELALAAAPSGRELALAGLTGLAISLVWYLLDEPWMRLGNATDGFRPVDAQGDVVMPWLLARLFGGLLVVPLATELCWRSFVMRRLAGSRFLSVEPRGVRIGAIGVSSLLCAPLAMPWLAALLAGLACAGLYRSSGKLWVPVVTHAVGFAGVSAWVVALGAWGFW